MITRFDGVLMYTAKRIIKKNVISFANKIIFPTFATSTVDPQESVVAFTYKKTFTDVIFCVQISQV